MKKTLYLDMDGVLADFGKSVDEILGCETKGIKLSANQWEVIRQHDRIYRSLNKMTDADQLIELCRNFCENNHYNLKILTAVPRILEFPWAITDKVLWVQQYYPDIPVLFGPYSKDKCKHCKYGDILIDDLISNITDWGGAGGIGILYTGIESMIEWLSFHENSINI